jgi:hypothetical protein
MRVVKQLPSDPTEILHDPDGKEPTPSGQVAVLSKDLFFTMRIRTILRQLGYVVVILQDASAFESALSSAVLGLVDFNQPVAWDELQASIASGVPIIAFGSHTDIAGFRTAKAAGVTRVTSNGEFSRSLPELAAKYAGKFR